MIRQPQLVQLVRLRAPQELALKLQQLAAPLKQLHRETTFL